MVSTLPPLSDRVEAAAGPDRELDGEICLALGWTLLKMKGDKSAYYRVPGETRNFMRSAPPRYTASIDAAMTLVPEGWNWMAGNRNLPDARAYVENGAPAFVGCGSQRNPARLWFEVVAATPALALLSAALRARML